MILYDDRGTETEEQIQKRLNNARAELEQGRNSGIFDHILENDNLETCYLNLKVTICTHGFIHEKAWRWDFLLIIISYFPCRKFWVLMEVSTSPAHVI